MKSGDVDLGPFGTDLMGMVLMVCKRAISQSEENAVEDRGVAGLRMLLQTSSIAWPLERAFPSMEKSDFGGVPSLPDLAKPVFERIVDNLVAEGFEPKVSCLGSPRLTTDLRSAGVLAHMGLPDRPRVARREETQHRMQATS